nr:uncharacterized protein LOC112778234 [Arachis hypogaea]
MPFGLKNAGATYQRLMNKIFSELIGKTVEVYVDDILAKTTRPDDLLSDLGGVFASLRQHGMRLNPLKCAFSMEAEKFLGFMITQRGVEANPEKCQAILQMKSPGCLKDVQRLAGRLTALSRFLVTEEALAAVLVREEGKAQQPVYFVSRALQGAELRYSKLEKLALTLLTSSRRLRQYFQGHRIVVRTDQAIRQVLQKPDLAGRMMTWAVELSQYDLQYEPRHAIKAQAMADFLVEVKETTSQFQEVTIQHVPRERNTWVDLLSKLASTKPGAGNRSLIQGMVNEPTVSLHLTESSPSWLDPITNFLELGKLPDEEKAAKTLRREAARYAIIQGQLFRKGLSQPLLKCLHPDQTDYVLREVHEGCCGHHIGGKALARMLIRAGYYWPSMMKDSREFVRKCVKYLIVAIDYYTKWIEAEPLASISSSNCRKFMWRQVITRFGISEVVISDNGTQFTDKKFTEFLTGLGVKQKFSSVEHPQTNGQVESANKVILLGLKKRLDNKKGAWADELASVLWSYRTTEQSATEETPFHLTYGVDAVIPVEIGKPSPRLLLAGLDKAVEKDLVEETREMAHLSETVLKQRIALRYNAKVLRRDFGERALFCDATTSVCRPLEKESWRQIRKVPTELEKCLERVPTSSRDSTAKKSLEHGMQVT